MKITASVISQKGGTGKQNRCMHAKSLQSCLTLCNLMDCNLPGSWSMDSPGKRSGLSCPSPGGLPDPGVEPESSAAPALQAESLPLSHQGSPETDAYTFLKF